MFWSRNLQERKEHDGFYAQEFRQRLHRPQLGYVRLVEEHETVHGGELG